MTDNSTTAPEIDFVAYHDLQAQCGISAFEELSKVIKCNWRISPHSEPSPRAIGAVMLDHSGFQKHVHKGPSGYKYLFHMSHDLGDIKIYLEEFDRLSAYDIIFTPTILHTAVVKKFYPGKSAAEIVEVGWAKFDLMGATERRNQFVTTLKDLPFPTTILYAPTWAKNYEWKDLFPVLLNYPNVNVIVKNHIYVNPGQPFPKGHEAVYARELKSADEMEAAVRELQSPGLIVAPRDLNICSLFPSVDLLISDSSSVLTEFLPFGNSVETGRGGLEVTECAPEMSSLFSEIKYIPTLELCEMLAYRRMDDLFKPITQEQRQDYGLLRPHIGQHVARKIIEKIGLTQVNSQQMA